MEKEKEIEILLVPPSHFSKLIPLLAAFLKGNEEPSLDETSRHRLKEAVEQEKIYFFAAASSEKWVGMCSLSLCFSTYKTSPLGLLDDMYVIPSMRKKGIARKLIEYGKNFARKKNCQSLLLDCDSSLVPMYESMGFRSLGIVMAVDLGEDRDR